MFTNNFDEAKETGLTPEAGAQQAELLPPPFNPCQDKITVNQKFTVETKIEVEDIDAVCFGEAVVKPYIPFPPQPSTCKLVIAQDVKVKIPIKFTVSLDANKRDVRCDKFPCDGQQPCQ